jgi:predicted ATPase/DNA-binding XRE family transcriptional regulator
MDYSFGSWVKRRRRSLALTQPELAERTGCSVSLIFKIEADQRRPSRQVAELLAHHLEIPPDQRELFLKVARQDKAIDGLESLSPPPVSQPSQINLPLPLTSLVGREHELDAILHQIQDPACRLLTLTGPGGVGKTRLALEVAHRLQDSFQHGICFVSLVGTGSSEFILPSIADSLGVMFSGAIDLKRQLFNVLKEKHILLVLDNLEHLLDGVELLDELLERVSDVKLLTTSREQLNLRAEWVFEVQGLPVPSSLELENLQLNSAAKLFLQRAKQIKREFTFRSDDLDSIKRICELVDGLPLGLELAASWVRMISVPEIAAEIERSVDFLTTTARDVPARHRSISSVLDHSWNLLSIEEQRVMMRLSVFRGGFTRQAAEQVAGATLEVLARLIDKSLLRRTQTGRYELHELVRQFAAAQLKDGSSDEHSFRQSHSSYYLDLLADSEPRLQSGHQPETLNELSTEIDNIRLAWDWAIAQGQLERMCKMSAPLRYYYELRSLQEGEVAFQKALAVARRLTESNEAGQITDTVSLGVFLAQHAYFMARLGRHEAAQTQLRESLQLLRTGNDLASLADAYSYDGMVSWFTGQFDQALEDFRQGLSLNQDLGRDWYVAINTYSIGTVLLEQGQLDDALRWLGEGLALCRATGDPRPTAMAINNLSRTLQALGRYAEAGTLLREGLAMAEASGSRYALGWSLERLALLAEAMGSRQEAHRLLTQGITVFQAGGDSWSRIRLSNHLGYLSLEDGNMAEAEQIFCEALQLAIANGIMAYVLDSLTGLALLRAREGFHELALKTVLYILQQPSGAQETKDRAHHLRTDLEAQLTPTQIEAIQAHVGEKAFEAVVEDLLK